MVTRTRVVVLLQILGHPRDAKRIAMLKAEGFEVEALAFERSYHDGRMPNCPVERLGRIEHGKYLRRVFKLARAILRIRRALRRNDVVYASGQDMAAIAVIAGIGLKRAVAMEVGDIVRLQSAPTLAGRAYRALDRFLVNRCSLLVVISRGFLEYYHQRLGTAVPALVIENKLETPCDRAAPVLGPRIRIGYFGLLRDAWSWAVLKSLLLAHPDRFELVLAGLAVDPQDIAEQAAALPNARYLGTYRSPDELPMLYGQVDVTWVCYAPLDADDWNKRWGRPNRFFESCCFGNPVISRAGCSLSDDVERYGIGLTLDTESVEDTVDAVAAVTAADVAAWRARAAALPKHVYLLTTESTELAQRLRTLATPTNLDENQ